MERRRLRLHSDAVDSPRAALLPAPGERVVLPGRCLTVADTEQGQAAAVWALELLEASARRGTRVPLVLCGFDQLPELSGPLEGRISQSASLVSRERLEAAASQPAAELAARLADVAGARFWLMVGLPALLAFDGWLSVLVNGEREPLRWPEGLRGLRPSLALEVAQPRPALAEALAHALLTTPEP